MFRLIICICVLVIAATTCYAQDTTEKMIINKEDLPPGLVESLENKQKIENYGVYAGLGKELGVAVNDSLEAVTDQASKFANTRLGKWVIFIVAYKVIGQDMIQFIIGSVMLIAGFCIFIWNWRKNCIPRSILVEHDITNKIKRYKTIDPNTDEKIVTAVVFLTFIGICMAVIFC